MGKPDEFIGEGYRDPLAAADEIEKPALGHKAVFPEKQPLGADLHPFGIPGAARRMGALAALVVHGRGGVPLRLHEIGTLPVIASRSEPSQTERAWTVSGVSAFSAASVPAVVAAG